MTLPPPLQRLLNTPVLMSEIPAGFSHPTVSALPPVTRYHTLGSVRVEFTNRRTDRTTTEAVSFTLFKTQRQADAFARTSREVKTGGLFWPKVAEVGRFVLDAAAATPTEAKALISFAVAHLRRSEG